MKDGSKGEYQRTRCMEHRLSCRYLNMDDDEITSRTSEKKKLICIIQMTEKE
ncbi:MAG: hypothetical protein ACLSA2_01930 [Candidatus Gastranaerophilaceae bacterium]